MDYSQPAKPVGWDKRIREISPNLSTVWNAPKRRWEIHYDSGRGYGPRLAIVVGNGIDYRPLDDRVLHTLKRGDSHNIGPKEIERIMDEEERKYLEAKERELERLTDAASREMADYSHRLIQKPIGVVTEKEIHYKRKADTSPTPNASVVSDD